MENYKICNLILKKRYNLKNYYEFYYKLINEDLQVKHSKNCLIFNKFKANIKVFTNGMVTITGIFNKDLNGLIDDYIKKKIEEEIIINKCNYKEYNNLYIQKVKQVEFLLNKNLEIIGIKSGEQFFINNIKVKPITEEFFMSCDNNKNKILFKNGKIYGKLNYKLFKSKNFFNNSTINIDYNSKLIFSNKKMIGTINIVDEIIKEKEDIVEQDFTIVSCNIQFNLNKTINRFKLFNNLIKNNFTSEYKLFDYSAVNLYYDNVVVSIFKTGNVIIKGLSNASSITNIKKYITTIYDIINSNL
jgi:hypothetical protein